LKETKFPNALAGSADFFLGDFFYVEGFFVCDVELGRNIRDHFLHGCR